MKNISFLICFFFSSAAVCLPQGNPETLKNGDFAKGKANWQGDGELVSLSADGKIQEIENQGDAADLTLSTDLNAGAPPAERALKVELQKFKWTTVSQDLIAHASDNSFSVSVKVKAMPGFEPLEDSTEYTQVDFKEGWEYFWSTEVWPKCDFFVRLHDATWYYRPLSLKPIGQWKSYQLHFPNLTARTRSFAIAFPPGTGTVLIKYAK